MARPEAVPEQQNDEASPAELLGRAAKAERKLLRAEADAEQELQEALLRLRQAQKQLDEAQQRYAKRETAVEAARKALLACQDARAAGPVLTESPVAESSAVGQEPDAAGPSKSGKKASKRG